MNTSIKAFTFLILFVALPSKVNAQEDKVVVSKVEKSFSLDMKDQRSLLMGVLGLITGYVGANMIQNSLEVPFVVFCGFTKLPEYYKDPNFPNFIEHSLAGLPTMVAGTALLYAGYKLTASSVKQDSIKGKDEK